ncbi:MAG: formate dehydrogenase accessory protein FdhE [Luteibacter sp.]
MKQAEAPPNAKWSGPNTPGVKSPDPIRLPDPATRFIGTARRLEQLSVDHPMQAWLDFVARIARAQHVVATTLAPGATLASSVVARAVEARLPPLAADGHPLDPSWRKGLSLLLDGIDRDGLPDSAIDAIDRLGASDAIELDRLSARFLRGGLTPEDAGGAVFVAAALQVYFTDSAARLVADALRLLEERALCPCCGSPSVAGIVMAVGQSPGTRYLVCSLCSTAWNHVRAMCITCKGTRYLALEGIEGDAGVVKAEACSDCHTYSKLFYQLHDTQVDAHADDLASLGLDMLVTEAGFARHAPNPLLLIA